MLEASRLAFDPLIPWVAYGCSSQAPSALWGVYLYLRGKAWLFRALALTVLALRAGEPAVDPGTARAAEGYRRGGDGPLGEHELPRAARRRRRPL
jgi:hypothetical protein